MCADSRKAARRFYAQALNQAEQSEFPVALEIEGVDEEIALLRLRLRTALEEHPEDMALMFRGIELLTKAVAARYRLSKQDTEAVDASAATMREELEVFLEVKQGVEARPADD